MTRGRRRSGLVFGVVLLLLGGAAAWWGFATNWMSSATSPAREEAGGGGGGGRGTGGGRRNSRRMAEGQVAVTTAIAVSQEVTRSVEGLGTVQAYNIVTVRVRVDGELDRIAFTEGQDVAQGDVLAQIDPRPYAAALEQARAAKAKDEAQLANAKRDLQRDEELNRHNFVAQRVADTQRALVAQLGASRQADQAMIDSATVQLGYATVRAPIAGRTGIRLIDQGNIVHAADSTGIVTITQLQPISVLFTLPQQSLSAVNQAQTLGAVTVVALDMDRKTELQRGRLAVVDNQIDAQTGTYKLKATLPNGDRTLWPGQFVNARVELAHGSGLVVPSAAVQRNGNDTFVYVVEADQTVARRTIKLAQIEQDSAVIDAGLEEGTRVVVSGQEGLRPGIRVVDATAPPEGRPDRLSADGMAPARLAPGRSSLTPGP